MPRFLVVAVVFAVLAQACGGETCTNGIVQVNSDAGDAGESGAFPFAKDAQPGAETCAAACPTSAVQCGGLNTTCFASDYSGPDYEGRVVVCCIEGRVCNK